MIPNNALQQLSGGKSLPFLHCQKKAVEVFGLRSRIRALSLSDSGEMGKSLRAERREAEKEQGKTEGNRQSRSLVASPLQWLLTDQQGAKSTRGRTKWRVLKNGKRRVVEE